MKHLVTTLALACLLPAVASAQEWRLHVVGAAALTHLANHSTLRSTAVQPGHTWQTLKGGAAYQLGLRLSQPLRNNLELEVEPRYSRVRGSYVYGFSQSEASTQLRGGLAGGYWQLPVGVRYHLSRVRQKPQLLARVVPGYGALRLVDPVGGQPFGGTSQPAAATNIALGYSRRPAHWQLGLEAGVGVSVLSRLDLSLLLYHGLTQAQLLRVQGSTEYTDPVTQRRQSYTISGQLRARLTTLSLQAALRLR
jgi:hypothetical protein